MGVGEGDEEEEEEGRSLFGYDCTPGIDSPGNPN